jgi:hypothetical protein
MFFRQKLSTNSAVSIFILIINFFYDSLLQGMTEDKRFSKQQIQMEIWFINPLMFSLLTLKTTGTFWAKY